MLQRDRQIRTQLQQLLDACLFATSFWLAFLMRSSVTLTTLFHLDSVTGDAFYNNMWLYFALIPAAPLVLESQGFYSRPLLTSRMGIFWPLLKGCTILTVGLVLVIYMFRESQQTPRGVMVFFGFISFLVVWLKEELMLAAVHSRMVRFNAKRRVVIAGIPSECARLKRKMLARSADSMEVVAEFDLMKQSPTRLIELLHEHSVSGVLLSARGAHMDKVESLIKLCEIEGVEAWLLADFFATQIAHASMDELFDHPLIVFRSTPETSWQMLLKLLMDFFGALVALMLFGPIMLVVAIAIKFTSPGPVFFRQQRSGLNGQPFSIFKFRTMMTNAEQFKHELAAMNEMTGPVFKVTNDPRVTPLGKILRKYSLDELPQIFNVIRGEMSLVGPRPLPVDEVKRFNDLAHRRRLSVKPGLTCLWQVSGRNKITDFKEWVRLDLEYIDNWSIWLDVLILLRTIPAVVVGTGAK